MTMIVFSATFETYGPTTAPEAASLLEEYGFRKLGEDWVRNDTYAYVRSVAPMDALRIKLALKPT
jgi:hypothetical protein